MVDNRSINELNHKIHRDTITYLKKIIINARIQNIRDRLSTDIIIIIWT